MINGNYLQSCIKLLYLIFYQVLHTLERMGVVVLSELWVAFLSAGGAVAGRLGIYSFPCKSGKCLYY